MRDGTLFKGDDESGGRVAGADTELLLAAYVRVGRTLDDLPYTAGFEELVALVGRKGDERVVLGRLQNLRKAGRLPKLGRGATLPVRLDGEEEAALVELVAEEAGSVGKRDGLPYTEGFQRVLDRFNAQTGRHLDHHTLWRLISKLAK